MRFLGLISAVVLFVLTVVAALVLGGIGWIIVAVIAGLVAAVGVHDVIQRRHSILRNYPILGHARFMLEAIRPEMQQYFIERNYDGRPFDRDTRTSIYERAKGIADEQAYGTERDVFEPGYEWLLQSIHSFDPPKELPRVRIGGPDCARPYDMALLNVSAMSFGALSGAALTALNQGAAKGGFAHDTGEGGLTKYHLNGGDVVWEIGTGYFGARTKDGGFDRDQFREKAAHESVKMVSLKLSQGAKPGIGGVLPGAKVTQEIADARSVPKGQTCVSPPSHKVVLDPARAGPLHRRDARAGGRQAGRLQALRRRCATSCWRSARRWSRRAPDPISSSSTGPRAAPAPPPPSTRTTSARR